MEWGIPVNDYILQEITKLDHNLCPEGFRADVRGIGLMHVSLARAVDALGEMSARAQGLNKVITTSEKLRQSPGQILYVMKDMHGDGQGTGQLVAMLKIGRKHLFLFDSHDKVHEVEPMCVLDFYVVRERQRRGLGRRLFDHMLADQGLRAHQLAVDGPSPKMEQFLRRNYGVERLTRQNNNFAVAPEFFASNDTIRSPGRAEGPPAKLHAAGRFSAPKPQSAIANVIHGGGSNPYREFHNSSNSNGRGQCWNWCMTLKRPRAGTPEPSYGADDEMLLAESPSPPTSPPVAPPARADDGDNDSEYLVPIAPEDIPGHDPNRPNIQPFNPAVLPPTTEAPRMSPAGSLVTRRDSQLTAMGYFDVKFYHSKLW